MWGDIVSIESILERQKTKPRFSVDRISDGEEHAGDYLVSDSHGNTICILEAQFRIRAFKLGKEHGAYVVRGDADVGGQEKVILTDEEYRDFIKATLAKH